jgi:hypothetical protein
VIRETPALTALPADIIFAGEKHAAEEGVLILVLLLHIFYPVFKILIEEVWESPFLSAWSKAPIFWYDFPVN